MGYKNLEEMARVFTDAVSSGKTDKIAKGFPIDLLLEIAVQTE